MMDEIKFIKIVLLIICLVNGAASYPKQGKVDKKGTSKDTPDSVKKQVNLKSADSEYQRQEDDIEEIIELNDGNIEGHVELKDNIINELNKNDETQQNTRGDKNNHNKKGFIAGDIEINDDNIEKHIDLPSELDINDQDLVFNEDGTNTKHDRAPKLDVILTETEDGQGNDDSMTEDVKIDDDGNVEGTVNLPDQGNTDPSKPSLGTNYHGGNEKAITRSIETDDNSSIDGTLSAPDYDGNNLTDIIGNGGILDAVDGNEAQVGDEGALTGSIELDGGDIQGTINLANEENNDSKLGGSNIQPENGEITGDMVIDDEGNIKGHISIEDDGKKINAPVDGHEAQVGNEDVLTGSIDLDGGDIQGTINLPNKEINDGKLDDINLKPGADNGQITEDMAIDDQGNIEGHISIHDDGKNSNVPVNNDDDKSSGNLHETPHKNPHKRPMDNKNCWMNLNSKKYLNALDEIDAKYSKVRRMYQDEIGPDFDKQMMKVLLSSQGKAPRAIHQAHGNPNVIPAGLNLGGFGMMRMPGSMLFFHRMKLRNSTIFRVGFLEANLMDMSLVARLALNDLHLRGSYERATTEEDMSVMYFVPTYGELDLLIKSVNYKMEGRLRMLNNRLMIELINSDIVTNNVLLSYANSTAGYRDIAIETIEDFVSRIKCDLDIWLKDYFNDYLMYFGILGAGKNSEIQLYEKQKTIKANEYADHAIRGIKNKLRQIKAANVKVPSFTLLTVLNHRIQLKNGILRGLDSMYRRSVAMTKKDKAIRILDIIIGFSSLKVQYDYEAFIKQGTPPLTGSLLLSADELSAHLEISQVDDSQTVDMYVDSIKQLKSESLTVEGPANRLIANFKYILENPIIAIMTNVMKHNIKMLKTLSRCEPELWGEDKEHNPYSDDNRDKFIPVEDTRTTIPDNIGKDDTFSEDKRKHSE